MIPAADLNERMQGFRKRFVDRARQDRKQIVAAWEAGDWDVLGRVCHGLAGNAGLFGFPELGLLAGQLENAAHEEGAEETAGLVAELVTAIDRC